MQEDDMPKKTREEILDEAVTMALARMNDSAFAIMSRIGDVIDSASLLPEEQRRKLVDFIHVCLDEHSKTARACSEIIDMTAEDLNDHQG